MKKASNKAINTAVVVGTVSLAVAAGVLLVPEQNKIRPDVGLPYQADILTVEESKEYVRLLDETIDGGIVIDDVQGDLLQKLHLQVVENDKKKPVNKRSKLLKDKFLTP